MIVPLLLAAAGVGTSRVAGPPRTVGVCWKPFSRATLQGEVRNMSAQLSATELIVYCGLGAQANGSFGVVTAAHPNRWGQPELCLPALAAARNGGIKSIQVMVESRTDMPAFDAALNIFGASTEVWGRMRAQAIARGTQGMWAVPAHPRRSVSCPSACVLVSDSVIQHS